MLRRRSGLPVLADVTDSRQASSGSFDRAQLEAFGDVLEAVADCRAVLVTGDAGKATLAIGLATAAVVKERRTALIECDLAVPVLAQRLGLVQAPGLHEYLREEAEAAQLLQPAVLAGPAAAGAAAPLVCVTAGRATADGPTLLESGAFRHAIERLRSGYDLVVLDGPPLDAAYSLARVAQLVDVTLACAKRVLPAKRLPVAVRGLVICR
jgi:Mrp family chromosome partitioning ATPase